MSIMKESTTFQVFFHTGGRTDIAQRYRHQRRYSDLNEALQVDRIHEITRENVQHATEQSVSIPVIITSR